MSSEILLHHYVLYFTIAIFLVEMAVKAKYLDSVIVKIKKLSGGGNKKTRLLKFFLVITTKNITRCI